MGARESDAFDEAYRCAGLPEQDRDAWVEILLRYPRNSDSRRGFPTESDRSAAFAALRADGRVPGHDDVHTLAWRHCVAREGVGLLGRLDAIEVSHYVAAGGTQVEANAYLDAVAEARTPTDDAWTVWIRFELSFDAKRIESYRQASVSPDDLAWFVSIGAFTESWDVERVHRWAHRTCPGAPFRVAASYRLHELSDADVEAWERHRTEGEDVVAALAMLAALKGTHSRSQDTH